MPPNGPASRRITSADIANEVGLSRATVSYVLNNTPHQKIPETTRKRVQEAASRLGYVPSPAARALQSGRSGIVLCLLPDWPIGPAISLYLERLSAALADCGLTFMIHPHTRSDPAATKIWGTITADVVLGLEPFTRQERAAMTAAGITVTMVTQDTAHPGYGRIAQQRIGRMQAEHLAATGHRDIGYAYPADPRVAGFAVARLDGVRQACADLELNEPVVQTLSMNPPEAVDQVRTWQHTDPPVTAICAYNDEIAFALLAAMRLLDLHAPHDLAVIGVDDIPTAAYADPPLTSVITDQDAVARYTSQTVVRALEGKPPPRRPGSDIVGIIRRQSA